MHFKESLSAVQGSTSIVGTYRMSHMLDRSWNTGCTY